MGYLMKLLVLLVMIMLIMPATSLAAPHRHRVSHVKACAAMTNARCQAKLIRSVGGGVAVPTYFYLRK